MFYVLPLLAPSILLIAAGAMHVVRQRDATRLLGWVRWFPVMVCGLVVGAGLVALVLPTPGLDIIAGESGRLHVLLAITLVLMIALLIMRRRGAPEVAGLAVVAALGLSAFALVGGPALEASKARLEGERIGKMAGALGTNGRPIHTWHVHADRFVYYTESRVREVRDKDELEAELIATPGHELVVITRESLLVDLATDIGVEIVARQPTRDGGLVLTTLRWPVVPATISGVETFPRVAASSKKRF